MDASVESVVDAGLDQGIARFLGVKGEGASNIRMADVRAKAANDLTLYGVTLLNTLSALGISIPPAIQLHSPDEGHVVALGNNPATDQVTVLINNDDNLLRSFKEIEVLHVVMRRTELRLAGQPMSCQHFNLGLTSLGCIAFFTEA